MEKSIFVVVLLFLLKTVRAVYVPTKCGFHGSDYSIKWAFEPQTQSIVFVLKTTAPPTATTTNFSGDGKLVTGVAFETEKHKEFIGVEISKQNNGKMKVIEAVGGWNDGSGSAEGGGTFEIISSDATTTTTSKVKEITLKKRPNGDIIAEFARPLKGKNERELLMGCKTFHFPTKWAWVPAGSATFSLLAKQREICELVKNCLLDVQEIKKKIKHRDSVPTRVDIAHSVDVSGKGDPCSFRGENYDVQWAYDNKTTEVNFVMRQKASPGQWWSAVGIGDNMSDMDIGIVFLNGAEPVAMGDYYSNSYGVPEKDLVQDWKLDKSKSKWGDDEQVEVHFSRQLVTEDNEKDHSLDGCVLFQFAPNGGTYGDGYQIHKHKSLPDLYKACDLKKHCVAKRTQLNLENESPEISHSNDGTNGSRINFLNEEQQQQPLINKRNESVERANATFLTKTHSIQNVQKETEGQRSFKSNGNRLNETKSTQENNKEQKGTNTTQASAAQNGSWTMEMGVGFKPMKKRGEDTGEATIGNAEREKAFDKNNTANVGKSSSIESTMKNDDDPTKPRPNGHANGGGVESPFSLNAFLGNEKTNAGSKLIPVGESLLTGVEQNNTKKEEVKFGIGQLIAENGGKVGNINDTLPANEMTEPTSGTTTANSELSSEKNETTATRAEDNKIINNLNEALNETTMENNNATSVHNISSATNDYSPPTPYTTGGQTAEAVVKHPATESGNNLQNKNNSTSVPFERSIANGTDSSNNVTIITNASPEENDGTDAVTTEKAHNSTTETAKVAERSGGLSAELINASSSLTSEVNNNNSTMTTVQTLQNEQTLTDGSTSPSPSTSTVTQPTPGNDTTMEESNTSPAPPTTTATTTTTTTTSTTPSPPMTTTTTTETETTALLSNLNSTTNTKSEMKNTTTAENEHQSSAAEGSRKETKVALPILSITPNATDESDDTKRPPNGVSKIGQRNITTENSGQAAATTGNGGSGEEQQRQQQQPPQQQQQQIIKLPVTKSKCEMLRPDLPICKSYMNNYLGRVREWAAKHDEPMKHQYGKACKLLAAVPHVPTLCCQIFEENCSDHLRP